MGIRGVSSSEPIDPFRGERRIPEEISRTQKEKEQLTATVQKIFYEVLAALFSIKLLKQEERGNHYKALSDFYDRKATRREYYDRMKEFGRPITFGLNQLRPTKEAPNADPKVLLGACREQFAHLALELPDELRPQDLSEIEKNFSLTEGVCLGISLDFIRRYLETEEEEPPLKRVKVLGKDYSEGATERAVALQILRKAMLSSEERQQLNSEREEHQKSIAETLRRFEEIMQRAGNGEAKESENEEIILEMKSLNERTLDISRKATELISHSRIGLIEALGIKTSEETTFNLADANPNLQHLLPGAYLLSLNGQHAISLIKTPEGEVIMMDPNIGALSLYPGKEGAFLSFIFKNTFQDDKMQTITCIRCSAP